VKTADGGVLGIVKLCVAVATLAQMTDTIAGAGAKIVEATEDDRLRRTNFGAGGRESALLPVVTKGALECATGIRQRLRATIDHAEGTGDNAITATIADVVLHEDGTDFGSDDGTRRTGFEAAGFFAMFADIGKKDPAKRIFAVIAVA